MNNVGGKGGLQYVVDGQMFTMDGGIFFVVFEVINYCVRSTTCTYIVLPSTDSPS